MVQTIVISRQNCTLMISLDSLNMLPLHQWFLNYHNFFMVLFVASRVTKSLGWIVMWQLCLGRCWDGSWCGAKIDDPNSSKPISIIMKMLPLCVCACIYNFSYVRERTVSVSTSHHHVLSPHRCTCHRIPLEKNMWMQCIYNFWHVKGTGPCQRPHLHAHKIHHFNLRSIVKCHKTTDGYMARKTMIV